MPGIWSVARVAAGFLLAIGFAGGCGGDDGSEHGAQAGGESAERFYGVISEPDPAALARLGGAEVGTLRINLAWGSVQSVPQADYDWSLYDALIGEAAGNDIQVLATVYGSPVWAEPTPEHPPLGASLPAFGAFVAAAVERYGSDGSFWSERPELPRLPIADWELWNEPNSATFWKPRPSSEQYLTLLRTFNAAIKAGDPGARVLLGGLFPTARDGPSMESFLSQVYRGGGRELFDAVDVHPYARTPSRALEVVESARGVMGRFNDAQKPVWITEVGWASSGRPSGVTVGPERQAGYLSRTAELAAAHRDRLRIAGG